MPSKPGQPQPGANIDATDSRRDVGMSSGVKSGETKRGRGRPVGSKNRPHGLIPKELAAEFLGIVRTLLPPEHYEEMRAAVIDGKSISVLSEAQITLKLMGPAIWRRLLEESQNKPSKPKNIDADMIDEIGEVERPAGFSRDLNERMKIYMSLMEFIDKSERRNDEATSGSKKPILELFAKRGVDGERLRILVGIESGDLGGDPNQFGRQALGLGTLPDTLPERPRNVSDHAEVEAVGPVVDPFSGDGALGVREEQL